MLKKFYFSDSIVILSIVLIVAAEAAHLYGVVLHKSFTGCVPVFLSLLCPGLLLVAGGSLVLAKRTSQQIISRPSAGGWFFFVALVLSTLLQITVIVHGSAEYRVGDMTVETVGSFLETNELYLVNPLTGSPYEIGMPSRIRILCLPSLYGMLCSVFQIPPHLLIRTIVPVAVLLFSYFAYACVARSLFEDNPNKRLLFLFIVSVLFWVGSYAFGVDGFGILYAGWRGVVIRNAVLIPYVVSACLRKKYLRALLCVFAEACIVWTLYGLGACAVVMAGMIVAGMVKSVKTGREGEP